MASFGNIVRRRSVMMVTTVEGDSRRDVISRRRMSSRKRPAVVARVEKGWVRRRRVVGSQGWMLGRLSSVLMQLGRAERRMGRLVAGLGGGGGCMKVWWMVTVRCWSTVKLRVRSW